MFHWIRKWLRQGHEPAHLISGRWGEGQAVRFLKANGYRILGRRVRVGKHDELDVIAGYGEMLVFVEVKTRKNEQYGRPFSSVGKEKRKRLSRAAVRYLKRSKIKPPYIRFDVIEVVGQPDGDSPEIRHIENAFPLDPAFKLWW